MINQGLMKNTLAVLLVATLYVYFLIFAQFSFLENLKTQLPSLSSITIVMGSMGISGVIASLFAIQLIQKTSPKFIVCSGLLICAIASMSSLLIKSTTLACLIAVLIASGIGLVSVGVICLLPQLVKLKQAGKIIGLGTGLAYLCCNLPLIFQATANQQAVFSATICLVLFTILKPFSLKYLINNNQDHFQKFSLREIGFIGTLIIFAMLVWLDSAAFYVIQQNAELKTTTWHSLERLWLNGGVHIIMAIIAGELIDRQQAKYVPISAFILLALAVIFLSQPELNFLASPFYCAGVSFYSTALIAYPVIGNNPKNLTIAYRAGVLYAFAGWVASALGIGMAQDLNYIPSLFLIISGLLISILNLPKKSLPWIAQIIILFNIIIVDGNLNAEDIVKRGRQVYLQEGCINCHSQFVRLGTKDEEFWGPATKDLKIHLDQNPPLIGNRRVGPDLQNIGNRRNREWLRLHFINPALLSAGSKMPSYQHLFSKDNNAGNDLIEYLMSLGKDTISERVNYTFKWEPSEVAPITHLSAKKIFQESCSQCHAGLDNQKPVLEEKLQIKPPNLFQDPFKFMTSESEILPLLRIIKFGLVGSTMPGHEYFSDSEIIGIGEYIIFERKKRAKTNEQ